MRRLVFLSLLIYLSETTLAEVTVIQTKDTLTIANSYFKITHKKKINAGLPTEIRIGGNTIPIEWNDGVYHRSGFEIERGILRSLRFTNRPTRGASVLSGSCRSITIVKRSANEVFIRVEVFLDKLPSSPLFTYYFRYSDSPIIEVEAQVFQQRLPVSWSELKLFDLKFKTPFNFWFCSKPCPLINPSWDIQYLEGKANTKLRFDKEPLPGHWRIPREHKGQRWVAGIGSGYVFGLLRTERIITKRGWYDSWPYISNDCKNIRGVWLIPWEGEKRKFRVWLYIDKLTDVRRQLNAAYAHITNNLSIKSTIPTTIEGKHYNLGKFTIYFSNGEISAILYDGKQKLTYKSKIFEIEWKRKSGKYFLIDSTQWKTIRPILKGDILTITFSRCAVDSVKSKVTVTFKANGSRLESAIRVEPSKDLGIWRIRFPIFELSPFAKSHKLYLPVSMGIAIDQPFTRGVDYYCPYPTIGATMQWIGLTGTDRRYVSLACYDDKPFIKDFIIRNSPDSNGLFFAIDWSIEDMGVLRNRFTSPGPVVMETGAGDWFDAFKDYKRWFYTTKFAPVDNPESAKRIALWFRSWHGDWDKPYDKIAKQANVPIGMHTCTWFATNHDDYYPQYFPIREGFDKTLTKWKKWNWTVIAYINGILHDSESILFRMLGYKYALRDMDGKLTLPKFNKTVDAYMCVATSYWQKVMKETIVKLVDKIGVDGVYIDMVSGTPALCFDKTHNHPIGGGSWWIENHRKVVNDCRRILKNKGNDVFFISEYPADCYAGAYNGFLFGTVEWFKDFVPIFQTLFSGKLILYAQEHSYAREPQFWRVVSARELCFGAQIGWFRTEEWKFQDESTKRFVYNCARWRDRLKSFISTAEFIPAVTTDAPQVSYFHSRGWCITAPAVMSSCWKKNNQSIIIFANVSTKPIEINAHLDYNRLNLSPTGIEIIDLSRNVKLPTLNHLKFTPDQITVLKLLPQK